jgi:uncharacterized protein YbjQ (UPF0145 family)
LIRCPPSESVSTLLSSRSEIAQRLHKKGRRDAVKELVGRAEEMGANAIVELKFHAPAPNGDNQIIFTAQGRGKATYILDGDKQ